MNIIGRNITRLLTVGSTNEYLNNSINLNNEFEDGDIVVALEQSSGKGRGKKIWESEPGKNLTFSVLLKPDFIQADHQFLLNKAISLGILEFIKSIINNLRIKIKWPNDIYINDGKVAGILIDNIISGNKITYSVIGIGININQLDFDEFIPNPVSLKSFTDKKLDLDDCLHSICHYLNFQYLQLCNLNFSKLDQSYHSAMYRLNENHKFKVENKIIEARIIGVTKFGQLQLETLEKEIIEFDYNEIEFII